MAESAASTAATAGPSSLPSGLNREPSQQELEVARQLIEHSKSIPAQQTPESHVARDHQPGEQRSNGEASSRVSNEEHHDLDDSLQSYVNPYPSSVNVTSTELRAPSSGVPTISGQMCRYVKRLHNGATDIVIDLL